jgi:hypothetical protein
MVLFQAHEIVALEILTLLIESPTDDCGNSNIISEGVWHETNGGIKERNVCYL